MSAGDRLALENLDRMAAALEDIAGNLAPPPPEAFEQVLGRRRIVYRRCLIRVKTQLEALTAYGGEEGRAQATHGVVNRILATMLCDVKAALDTTNPNNHEEA